MARVGGDRANLPRHGHGHQNVRRRSQPHVLAAFQAELPGFFAAEAQGEETVLAKEPDWADHSMGFGTLGVALIELDDQIVRLMHRSVNQLTHFRPPQRDR